MSNPDAMVSGISGGGSLSDLLGKVDNLNDPVPVLNKRSVAYGLVLFLLVSSASASCLHVVRYQLTRRVNRYWLMPAPFCDSMFAYT